VRSRDVISRHVIASWSYSVVENETYRIASFRPSTAASRWLPVKWRHFQITSGHLRSRKVISYHVTASSHKLQPCRKWNAQYTPAFGLPQPLTGDFRCNDVPSGSLAITWGHVTSFPVMSLPPASYSLVGSETYSIREFSAFYRHFQVLPVKWRHFFVTSGHLRSCDVVSCHVTASYCELQPFGNWYVQYTPVFGLPQQLQGNFRSNDVTSKSLPVTWGHVTTYPATWLPPPTSYSLVKSEMYSIRQFPALYNRFQLTSGQTTSLPGHFRSPEVTWHDFLSRDCLLLQATAL